MSSTLKLSENNYNQWAVQMKLLLQKGGLWSIVEGRNKSPNSANLEKLLDWEDKRDQALATILLEMTPRVQSKYISATDPVELWKQLETDLKDKSTAHAERPRREREPQPPALPPMSDGTPHLSIAINEEASAALKPHDWIAGTGSSSHFTGRRDAFSKYVQLPEVKKVTTNAADLELEAVGYGEVVLRLADQRQTLRFSAWHVPTMKYNLVAPQELAPQIEFASEEMTLKKEDGTTILTVGYTAGIPVLHGEQQKKRPGPQGRRRGGGGGKRPPKSNGEVEGEGSGEAASAAQTAAA
jgi:hypothetical protein